VEKRMRKKMLKKRKVQVAWMDRKKEYTIDGPWTKQRM